MVAGGGERRGHGEGGEHGSCLNLADMSAAIAGGERVVKTEELDVITQLFKISESRGRKY